MGMAVATPLAESALEMTGNERFATLNGIYSIWRRDVIRFVRDRSRLIGSLGQPLLFLVVFGSGLSSAIGRLGQTSGMPGLNYVQFMFPGIIVMAILFTAIMSAISVVWDREFGFLKEVLVAPVPRWAVAVGKALGGSTTAVFQGVIILVFAPFIGAGLTPLAVVELLPVMFLTAFAMCSEVY
jgi:ABC-2 type transport system permease protein